MPESEPEYGQADTLLSEESIEKINSPAHLSQLQQQFLIVH